VAALCFLASSCALAQNVQPAATPLPFNEWSQTLRPTSGSPLSFGSYSNGCISGASSLPLEGTGYQVMKIMRNRFYGHPLMMDFIKRLGTSLDAVGSAVLIGDVGQPRGGPMPYGHASHQIGLDVDIWYWTHPEQRIRSLSESARNTLEMKSVLAANGLVDPTLFTAETIMKLKFAATDPKVERIFVNPAIKTYLCTTLPTTELYWLHALRPWDGHEDHFHVRLACAADSPDCNHQSPQAPGDGCNELMPERLAINLNPNTVNFDHAHTMNSAIEQIVNPAPTPGFPAACASVLRREATQAAP
jgi:penicillin-insensitive murein endopeptidase